MAECRYPVYQPALAPFAERHPELGVALVGTFSQDGVLFCRACERAAAGEDPQVDAGGRGGVDWGARLG